MEKTGTLKLYLGCMYSGKTSEIQREYRRMKTINKKVVIINYENDKRYGEDDYVYSHDKVKEECLLTQKLTSIKDELLEKTDVIIINEGQFFDDILEFCIKWCDKYGKDIIICGLDGDFMRKPFGQICSLIPLCDEIVKLTAYCTICSDGTPAIFSHRITNSKDQILIGNKEYIPVCRKHYLQNNKL